MWSYSHLISPSHLHYSQAKLVSPADFLGRDIKLTMPSETRDQPWVYLPSGADTSNTYLVILIDSGVPLLHWLQPNLVTDSSRNLTFNAVVQDASTGNQDYHEVAIYTNKHQPLVLRTYIRNHPAEYFTTMSSFCMSNPTTGLSQRTTPRLTHQLVAQLVAVSK